MFRNSDPPISLFSFQDIVTTLIGIMVLFVLLLSLELIEATRIFEESSPVREELARLREQRKSLETQVEEQARRLKELAAELDSVSDMSEAELSIPGRESNIGSTPRRKRVLPQKSCCSGCGSTKPRLRPRNGSWPG